MLARDVHLEQAGAQTIMANQVTMGRGSGGLLVLAARIDGDVRTVVDWRDALAFGAAFGLIVGSLLGVRAAGSRSGGCIG